MRKRLFQEGIEVISVVRHDNRTRCQTDAIFKRYSRCQVEIGVGVYDTIVPNRQVAVALADIMQRDRRIDTHILPHSSSECLEHRQIDIEAVNKNMGRSYELVHADKDSFQYA